jgi:hypothetical protein
MGGGDKHLPAILGQPLIYQVVVTVMPQVESIV